jgi:hypothetical protein
MSPVKYELGFYVPEDEIPYFCTGYSLERLYLYLMQSLLKLTWLTFQIETAVKDRNRLTEA